VRANNYSLIVLAPFSGVAAKLLWGLIISAGVSCVTATKSHAAERQYGDLYCISHSAAAWALECFNSGGGGGGSGILAANMGC
jgi:hypothetical protein